MTRTHASESVVSAPPEPVHHPTEAVLLQRLRDGQDEAFGELYELHVGAVRRLARGLSTDRSEAEDITAETFFRVLQALRRGSGPRDSARAYLLTVARRVSWEWQAARREVPIPDDELSSRIGSSHEASSTEQALIANAFSRLPERWRVVLWQTEVEGVQPAVVAPHFGLSPNATAALARRARLGLRAAYLQAHVANQQEHSRCQTVLDKLGGYTAGVVTGTQARKVRAHLRRCPRCRDTHGQLRDVFSSLRAHAGALVALVPAAGLAIAGTGSSAAGSAASTALVAAGTKMKVGLAVASTTAAGALVATPVVVDWDAGQPMGMRGHGPVLTLASSPPSEPPPATSEPSTQRRSEPSTPPQHPVITLTPRPAAHERALPADPAENEPVRQQPEREPGDSAQPAAPPADRPSDVQSRLDPGAAPSTGPSSGFSTTSPGAGPTGSPRPSATPTSTPTSTPTTEPTTTDPTTTEPRDTEPTTTEPTTSTGQSTTTESPTPRNSPSQTPTSTDRDSGRASGSVTPGESPS